MFSAMNLPEILGYRVRPYRGDKATSVASETRFLTPQQAFNEKAPVRLPVVLIRGLGRSAGFWLDFPDHVAQYSNVVLFDLLGTGRSPSRFGRGSIPSLARDLAHSLKALHLLPCHLVGISLGGMVAAECARQIAATCPFPQRCQGNIASLTALSSSARFTGEERINRTALGRILKALRNPVPRNGEFAEFLVSAESLMKNPKLPQLWDELWEQEGFNKLAVVRQLLAAAFFDGHDTLDAIERPALFIVSKQDKLVSWKNTPRLWDKTRTGELHVLETGGHDLPTEDPEGVASILRSFFQRVEAREFESLELS